MKDILNLIGNTPMFKIEDIYVKAEYFNPSGSIKDRIALQMIKDALDKNKDIKGFIEATSGNTGISMAFVSSVLGYKFVAVMPENASIERTKIIKHYDGEVIYSPCQ
jgi:cysteine synthase